MQSICMQLKLSFYPLKIDCYDYKMFYINLMVTIKQKPIENTQKIKEKDQSLSLQKVIKSQRKKAREEERNYKAARKQLTSCQQ